VDFLIMEQLVENIAVYTLAILVCLGVVILYLRRQKKKSKKVEAKIAKAKLDGIYEPISLHPVVDPNKCIATGACIAACPEKDILGIVNGKATPVNASHCIGHGACFHACPTQAITLVIGTEKRGVELPHVNKNFETNVPGIYIAGELGGMGLIKNSVTQGRQAVENIVKAGKKSHAETMYDLVVVGAGPAGIAATLTAKKHHLRCLTIEQDTLGGTVFSFPRSKIVMTAPMDLPLYGKLKLFETSKPQLLDLWKDVLKKNDIQIKENTKVESITSVDGYFKVETHTGEHFTTKFVLLAIGRRGTPRKLGVPGEHLEKVAYRLLEAENIEGKEIVVVGGGDSAIESALLLAVQNHVILSYRNEAFSRIKPKNLEKINAAISDKSIDVRFNTAILEITSEEIIIAAVANAEEKQSVKNDLVYIFAGGELPSQFLKKVGIEITTKFGEAILKHE
jgi:thioredoxin reductase/Pyruvate/2-oxoacid:ferredoxin oxidoreductase delta subunit